MKILIFDAGPLINLSMNGLLPILENLKKKFDGKFIITRQVKYETVDRPSGILRFELGALRVSQLIEKGILESPESIGINSQDIDKETNFFLNTANHILIANNGVAIPIVSEAEMSCLALSSILTKKGITNIIAIDERTTRVLSENPKNLEKLMSERLHYHVKFAENANLTIFSKFRFIRSPEIVYTAYKKGLLGLEGKKALEAALYATKFHGSAISFEEVEQLKKM